MKTKPVKKSSQLHVPEEGAEKSEQLRRRILDATLGCYVKYGWSGTNMSVISRDVGMTRGMIQYYFPTLEDVVHASVSHLNSEWQKRYFTYVKEQEGRTTDRLEVGVEALWRLMRDPLHIARQELVAAARSDAALRAVMQKEAGFDEDSTLERAKQTYPDLAERDNRAFRQALDFTVVFLEGLSRHQFSNSAESRSQLLRDMLKEYLSSFWQQRGIEVHHEERRAGIATNQAAAPSQSTLDDRERQRVLALLLKAASILSDGRDEAIAT